MGRATEQTTNLIVLDREVRTSALVFNNSSYAAGNKTTLSGTNQWSDPASSPLPVITDALDSMIMRANIGIFGRRTATMLRRHPKIVKAYNGSLGDDGMVPLAFLQDLLELEQILVGEARINTAKPGQNPLLARAWGPHASFIYRDRLADSRNGTTFGFTAQWGDRIAGSIPDPDIGLRGGQRVRVGESVKELIAAKDLASSSRTPFPLPDLDLGGRIGRPRSPLSCRAKPETSRKTRPSRSRLPLPSKSHLRTCSKRHHDSNTSKVNWPASSSWTVRSCPSVTCQRRICARSPKTWRSMVPTR